MYDHHMYDLFDKNIQKYHNRITSSWNISKYEGRTNLSKEEYLDALNIFRGPYGSSYIYFFRYPPTPSLGPRMQSILEHKDIYQLNLNDEDVLKNIKDIFYGYNMSESDNEILTKEYYETITNSEYFANYDDNIPMNFKNLNHIAIAFTNDYCKAQFLTKYQD